MTRLSPLLSLLLLPLAGCTVGTGGGIETTSVECVDDGGEVVCSEHEDGDEPAADGDLVCSDTGCVTHCEEGDGASHCVTECEHGMRCEEACEGDACSLSCTCPDGDGGGDDGSGGGDGDVCALHPDSLDCFCIEHPDSADCQGDGDGGGDYCAEHPDDLECFCQANPDAEQCHDGGGDGSGCPDGDLECFCRENPESPECQGA